MAQNLRYPLRMLRKNPGFTAVTILTLALGIGANTAIFSVVYSALLRPLPYRQPNQLMSLAEMRQQQHAGASTALTSYPDFLDWKRISKSFQSFAGHAGDPFTMIAGSDAKYIFGEQVTPNFFSTLGVKPMLGRDFVEADSVPPGDPPVAIISSGLWRAEFNSDPAIVGRLIQLNRRPATIVGVLPPEFEFAPAGDVRIWVPLHRINLDRSFRWFHVIARRANGVSPVQARAEMMGITAQLAREYPEDRTISLVIAGLSEKIVGEVRPLLLALLGAVGFVLLITCANVANLFVTRSIGRRKEFAVRAALGASRGTLLRQLLTESLLLSSAGAVAGLLWAGWGIRLLVSAIPEDQLESMPYLNSAGINIPVLTFLCGVTLLTSFLFSLAPSLTISQIALNDALKDETRGGPGRFQTRIRNGLVIAEIAISLVLLVGAGLMVRSLHNLINQDPGFDPSHVLTFGVTLPEASYPYSLKDPDDNPTAIRFDHSLTKRLGNLPGVRAVGSANLIPAQGGGGTIRFLVEGRSKAAGQEDESSFIRINAGYFSALKIPLLVGRFFADTDKMSTPGVLIVNQAFVKRYLHNDDPVGKRILFAYPGEPFRQIIGIVGNAAEIDVATAPPPVVYSPYDQGPSPYLRYLVRTTGEPGAFISAARAALHELDPQLSMMKPATLERVIQQSPAVFLRRYPAFLIGAFAALALILAIIGLYGLISHTIVQRTREIGIRVALGAQRADILRLVMGQGLRAALTGVAIGVAASLGVTRLLGSLLFGVKPGDWPTFVSVALLLLIVALAGCALPARRAMRVDPMVALRHD